MEAELKPCPFCGCTPRLHKPNRTAYAWCEACRTSPWKLADWNKRASDPKMEKAINLLMRVRGFVEGYASDELRAEYASFMQGGRDGI